MKRYFFITCQAVQLGPQKLRGAIFSLKRLLETSEVKVVDIDAVVLVGGSILIPSLRSRLRRFFNRKKPLTEIDPDTAVAVGCARASED